MTEIVSSDAPFVGPKYPNVEESHKYGPVPARHGPDREMMGPVYPGVDSANKYDVVSWITQPGIFTSTCHLLSSCHYLSKSYDLPFSLVSGFHFLSFTQKPGEKNPVRTLLGSNPALRLIQAVHSALRFSIFAPVPD